MFLFSLLIAAVSQSGYGVSNVLCYDFLADTPENLPLPGPQDSETWCYGVVEWKSEEAQVVFNVDEGKALPETTALLLSDGSLIHGSLNRGELSTIHAGNISISPFSVPLTPPYWQSPIKKRISVSLENSLERVIRFFSDVEPVRVRTGITEGVFEKTIPETAMPYGGYWWSYSGLALARGQNSPLGKYDAFVEKKTGTNPKSVDWEKQNHSSTAVAWGGHCNGWSASSLLYKELAYPLWNKTLQKIIYNSDLNGIYAEASFCVKSAFYGKRYYGKPEDDAQDIYPDKFHKVLEYYIGGVGKAVAFDYHSDAWVDNNVISGYKFEITKDATDPLLFKVNATLKGHNYDSGIYEDLGVARPRTFSYQYTLKTDEAGNILSGTWTGYENPDFLWVPLSQSNCGRENPNLNPEQITALLNDSKKATPGTSISSWKLPRALQASEEVPISISVPKGVDYKIYVEGIGSGDSVYVVADGEAVHGDPFQGQSFNVYSGVASISAGNITNLKLKNYASTATTSQEFKITKIEFLGGN